MYAVSAKQKNTICVLLLLFVFLILRTPKLQNEYVVKPVQSGHFCCSTPSISPDGRAWTPLGTGGPSFRSLSVSADPWNPWGLIMSHPLSGGALEDKLGTRWVNVVRHTILINWKNLKHQWDFGRITLFSETLTPTVPICIMEHD